MDEYPGCNRIGKDSAPIHPNQDSYTIPPDTRKEADHYSHQQIYEKEQDSEKNLKFEGIRCQGSDRELIPKDQYRKITQTLLQRYTRSAKERLFYYSPEIIR